MLNPPDEPITRFALRVPTALYERFKALAEHEQRSVNAQLLVLMRRAVEAEHEQRGEPGAAEG